MPFPKKKLVVVAMDADMVKFYAAELEYVFGDHADVIPVSARDSSLSMTGDADVYAVSTCVFDGKEDVGERLAASGKLVLLKMTVTRKSLDRLAALPYGSRAMLVNLSRPTAMESIVLLNQLGVKNIEFEPVFPGLGEVPDLDLAITPGEFRFVPPRAKKIIDIGNRRIDANTMAKIAAKLRCDDILAGERFLSYIDELVRDDYSFSDVLDRSFQSDNRLMALLSLLDIGLISVDEHDVVMSVTKKAEYVLGAREGALVGRPAAAVLPSIPFAPPAPAGSRPAPVAAVAANGADINAAVRSLWRGSRYLGAFAVVERFEDEERRQSLMRRQVMKRGYVAKYDFSDIRGESPEIRDAKRIAEKMASSDSAVLISGESGTGKELFAHAIHRNSPRREHPFVAINCAAIPDGLFESELFGYEDGAFTGARRGGKPGLFELAHRGTLFLDEVEGISPGLQVKLLRAIQEREIMRVGGGQIISVDVRIIGATNEDLQGMVRSGTFRKDLYYRLNTLPLTLPPLRRRRGDILLLLDSIREELGGRFSLGPEAEAALLTHPWPGNIRELRNCVEFLLFSGAERIAVAHLPAYIAEAASPERAERGRERPAAPPRWDLEFVLRHLADAESFGRGAGRKSIAAAAAGAGVPLTEPGVRAALAELERRGAVLVPKGRGGSRLTDLGRAMAAGLPAEVAQNGSFLPS